MNVCDPSLEGHASRVGAHAEAVARRLGWTEEQLAELRLGAALHDVGKVNVRPGVLSKPGRLDDAELAEVRAHPVEGAWLIAGVPSLAPALPYVLFHHERWDGVRLPDAPGGPARSRSKGRLLAVADAFDAMTSAASLPRRPASSTGPSAEIERCSGTQFDPTIAGVFVDAYAAGEIVATEPASLAV